MSADGKAHMESSESNEELRSRAVERLKKKRDFKTHVLI